MPFASDSLDQGSFLGKQGDLTLDLQALLVIAYDEDGIEYLAEGDSQSPLGKIAVTAATSSTDVPEPSVGLAALVVAGMTGLKLRRQRA